MEGLRNFVHVDNHCTRAFLRYEGQSSKNGAPEVSIREGPEELTLGAEVGSLEGCINVDHIAADR